VNAGSPLGADLSNGATTPKIPRRAALFDMDRTLLRRESASLYVRYQRDIGEASLGDLMQALYWVGQYTLGILDMETVAKKVVLQLRGMPETVMAARCDDFFSQYLEEHITDEGRLAVHRHQAAGEVCAIVTGASPYLSWPLAQRLGIEHVVATEFEIEGGIFTGRAEAPLCLAEGKVVRAERLAKQLDFKLEDAIFYTDSISDLPLLERVAERVIVNPDPRLKRVAQRRGWRIERW
jgi:HAD superfamily hydrolase (TIGR01490 family)